MHVSIALVHIQLYVLHVVRMWVCLHVCVHNSQDNHVIYASFQLQVPGNALFEPHIFQVQTFWVPPKGDISHLPKQYWTAYNSRHKNPSFRWTKRFPLYI